MERFQHSIEVKASQHEAYRQLMQFENYPRFLHDIEAVRMLDGSHLHWRASRPLSAEWDTEITEQIPDRCIAWRNIGSSDNARMELEPLAPDRTLLTMTMECDSEEPMSERIRQDLARFKACVETQQPESRQQNRSTQSDYSLSQSAEQNNADGRFTVSEEINLDEQSDQARHVGRMPKEAAEAVKKPSAE